MEVNNEKEIVENIVKNLVDVLDIDTISEKTGVSLSRVRQIKRNIEYSKAKGIKYLSWLIEKLEGIRIAKRMYRFKDSKELIMNLTELTEWEYDKFVLKGFKESYSLSELARYLNVSIENLNIWIEEGKFINRDTNEKYLPTRIQGNIVFVSEDGTQTTLWDLEHTYYTEWLMSKEDEKKFILETIKYLKNKYSGTFEETLKVKQDKTEDEAKDADKWQYLLKLSTKFQD